MEGFLVLKQVLRTSRKLRIDFKSAQKHSVMIRQQTGAEKKYLFEKNCKQNNDNNHMRVHCLLAILSFHASDGIHGLVGPFILIGSQHIIKD